ncbi:hypothetical protein MYAM1_002171 [Malassezia yamatoensis]|uniref:Uncharacterized protein n=1 Tax=Malassezia yamatoensis TaxID=253288 RepID=A0AAJ5YXH7_9BASI|nr:hypothetical protein MYAM1_002171 [Malassezia yamatoensis]
MPPRKLDHSEEYELGPEAENDLESEAFLIHASQQDLPRFSRESAVQKHLFSEFAHSPYGAIFFLSATIVMMLSVYFYVPSTLHLYMVCLCFAFPLVLAVDLARIMHRRQLPPTLAARMRVIACLLATSYTLYCALAMKLGMPYDNQRAPPLRMSQTSYNPNNETFYIASNLYNSEAIFPRYSAALLQFIEDVGPSNVYVSIYENDSKDRTPSMLRDLDAKLDAIGTQHKIQCVKKRKYFRTLERIRRLAYLRNQAMDPLYLEMAQGLHGRAFSKVIFLNDVIFNADAIHTLLSTADGMFDQACAIDYYSVGLYDTWVTRDVNVQRLRPLWPYFKRHQDQKSIARGEKVLVDSCWNGITAFDARWFHVASDTQSNVSDSKQPVITRLLRNHTLNDGETPAKLPLRFRTGKLCRASECELISLDMHRLAHPLRPLIYVNPRVIVAYDQRDYFMYHNLVFWRLNYPWHVVWEDWIATRIFGFISDIGRKSDPCRKFHFKMYSAAPSS